ncbi:universal stress protein [Geodermatophilus sp. SYSU D00965]
MTGPPPRTGRCCAWSMGADVFRTVLWATDGSKAAERALAAAKSVAQTYDARLIVTHVSVVLGGSPSTLRVAQESADAITAGLRSTVEDLRRDGVAAELTVTEMTPEGTASAIVEFARGVGADLIVVGTRGHNPLVGMLLGSVALRLVERAPCPLLAVPPE